MRYPFSITGGVGPLKTYARSSGLLHLRLFRLGKQFGDLFVCELAEFLRLTTVVVAIVESGAHDARFIIKTRHEPTLAFNREREPDGKAATLRAHLRRMQILSPVLCAANVVGEERLSPFVFFPRLIGAGVAVLDGH